MLVFNGRKEANSILRDIKKKIKKRKCRPGLAIILVGNNPESKLYIKLKEEAAKKIGVRIETFRFLENIKEERVLKTIRELNNDEEIHGIIVQLPLPSKFKTKKIIKNISKEKDVDGFVGDRLDPVLPSAIYLVLKKIRCKGKIIALVNSAIFGRALKKYLKRNKIAISYTLKKDVSLVNYDAIISVCGKQRFIKGSMIKRGAVLIDAGITRFSNGRVAGDVDRESVKEKASFLTPVPNGIGPLTVALLLKNTYSSWKLKKLSIKHFLKKAQQKVS